MDHHGARCVVAHAFVFLAYEHGDDSDGVEAWQRVDYEQQIPKDRIVRVNWAAGVLNDAQVRPALARCLAVPGRLKQREVAELNREGDKNEDCDPPLFRQGSHDAERSH